MMRQVAGALMEYEKARLVAKLRGARERKRNRTGEKVGGRKSHADLWPEVVEPRRLRALAALQPRRAIAGCMFAAFSRSFC
jgi:hypothetical protein